MQEASHIIQVEKVNRLLSHITRSVISSAVLAVLLAYIQAQQLLDSPQRVYIWLFILLSLSAARVVIARYHIRHPVNQPDAIENRLNILRTGVVLTSICWSSNIFLLDYQQNIEQLFLFAFILSGITSAAFVSYAIDKFCALAYVLFTVAPLLIVLIRLDSQVAVAMGLAGLTYMTFVFYSVNALNNSLMENILLRIETEERDEQIKQMAFHDALTGLPNRRLLQDRLNHAIAMSQRSQTGGALLFIDLDNFKKLNDTQGHEAGDMLLQQVAQRLKATARESDTACRLGGDEFVMMLENLSPDHQSARAQVYVIAEKVLNALNQPYTVNQAPYFVSPSIGASIFGLHGYSYDSLLKCADDAMYQAKRAGRNTVRILDEEKT